MPGKITHMLTMEEVRTRFDEWRQNRRGKARIPDELWSAAMELAGREGVNRTAAELHLDGGKLKRRMLATTAVPPKSAPPSFIELIAPESLALAECNLELECRHGKLRIELKGATVAYVAGLSRALLDQTS